VVRVVGQSEQVTDQEIGLRRSNAIKMYLLDRGNGEPWKLRIVLCSQRLMGIRIASDKRKGPV
jgi:hypothetical protein